MLRTLLSIVTMLALAFGGATAADKELKAKLVKVDVKKNVLMVKTDDGDKHFDVNEETKFIGPRGGVSAKGINDERLKGGVELKLVIAGNNRTLREVHIPEIRDK